MTVFEKFSGREGSPSLSIAVALLSIAFLAAIGFQTIQLLRDRSNLANVISGQERAVEQTRRLRDSVDAFAGDTAKLAQAGDPQAKQVVEALKSQNISIRPPAAPAAAH
ncbi:MAG TPA: hypothetical protein VKV32_07565 [Stellaceae bacterium]|nr:hypothetical protein [Stellaceae bacterium]